MRRYIVVRWLRLPLIRDWLAITLGDWTFSRRPLTTCERVHEDTHARQWHSLGWRFPFAYARSSVEVWCAGGDWYRSNVYEQAAYGAEARCEGRLA